MKRILHSDKLPECARWAHLAPLGFSVLVLQEKGLFLAIYNKSSVSQVCSVMTAGYWPHSFFHFFLTTTSSQSIKAQKKTWPISSHLKDLLTSPLVNNTCISLYKVIICTSSPAGGDLDRTKIIRRLIHRCTNEIK